MVKTRVKKLYRENETFSQSGSVVSFFSFIRLESKYTFYLQMFGRLVNKNNKKLRGVFPFKLQNLSWKGEIRVVFPFKHSQNSNYHVF